MQKQCVTANITSKSLIKFVCRAHTKKMQIVCSSDQLYEHYGTLQETNLYVS